MPIFAGSATPRYAGVASQSLLAAPREGEVAIALREARGDDDWPLPG